MTANFPLLPAFLVFALAADTFAAAAPRSDPRIPVARAVAARTGGDVEFAPSGTAATAPKNLLTRPLTADTAARIALLNNRHLQATLAELGISQADLIEAGLLANPTFDGMLRFPHTAAPALNIEGALAQDFLDLLMLPLRRRVAAAELEATQLRVADEVLTLIAETKSAFYHVQADQQLLRGLRLIIAANEAAVDLAQRRHDAGNITDLALATEQATYSQSRLDLARLELEMAADREKLNRLMGVWGDDTAWQTAPALPPLPAKDPAWSGLESLAVQQRLDLAAAKVRLGLLLTSMKLMRTYRYFGVIQLGVSSEQDTDGQIITGPTLSLSLPVFHRGQGRLAKLQAQLEQAESSFAALAIDIRSEVREAETSMTGQRRVAEFHRDILLPERAKVLQLTQLQYNAMQMGPTDLLVARQQELEAERGHVEAWRDYWIARAMLEKAVGGSLGGKSEFRMSKSETRSK